jgi:hypothetical protein
MSATTTIEPIGLPTVKHNRPKIATCVQCGGRVHLLADVNECEECDFPHDAIGEPIKEGWDEF